LTHRSHKELPTKISFTNSQASATLKVQHMWTLTNPPSSLSAPSSIPLLSPTVQSGASTTFTSLQCAPKTEKSSQTLQSTSCWRLLESSSRSLTSNGSLDQRLSSESALRFSSESTTSPRTISHPCSTCSCPQGQSMTFLLRSLLTPMSKSLEGFSAGSWWRASLIARKTVVVAAVKGHCTHTN
jgi:hypothetical protein